MTRDLSIAPPGIESLLDRWNATAQAYPVTACVHELIDVELRRDAGRPALAFRDYSWTCGQLDERAEAVADALRRCGVRPGAIIAISLQRSLELVSAILGVWRAGAAYMPLDPTFPEERLRFMLRDAGPAAAILSQATAATLSGVACPVIRVDSLEAKVGAYAVAVRHAAAPKVDAGGLAYVLYTSGSTGQPKGVAVAHRNVVSFFTGIDAVLGHPPAGTWLAITSIGFDISVLELFWTLARGFRVVIQEEGQLASASGSAYSLPHQITRHGVTHLQCTPSLAAMMVRDAETAVALGQLKQLLVGGEALPRDLARRLTHLVSGDVFNLYGPTETTIWSAAQRIDRAVERVLIGRPIANTRMYVLDAQRRRVGIGEAGELYIGGAGVAIGYLNRPDLTAERFISNPFTDDRDDRLYRTGDTVQYDSEGRLEFLGRVDQQVKVRGVRIELQEIEVVLRTHPGVSDAAAAIWEVRAGDARLAAYVVKKPHIESSIAELRHWLGTRLPEIMVPAAITFLDALPQTPNGKLDRRALPRPSLSEDDTDVVAPATRLEEQIAGIWADVLGVGLERVGVTEPFFEVGGHSLLMVEVQERLLGSVHQDVSLVELFRYPTVRTLAAFLADRIAGGTEQESAVGAAAARGRERRSIIARRMVSKRSSSATPTEP